MTSSREINSFFKLAIFCCNVLVFWFWQYSIFSSVLLIFSKFYSNFSCSGVRLFSKWHVSNVLNFSKVSVSCCAEGLWICLTFCNKVVSVCIKIWGITFVILGIGSYIYKILNVDPFVHGVTVRIKEMSTL